MQQIDIVSAVPTRTKSFAVSAVWILMLLVVVRVSTNSSVSLGFDDDKQKRRVSRTEGTFWKKKQLLVNGGVDDDLPFDDDFTLDGVEQDNPANDRLVDDNGAPEPSSVQTSDPPILEAGDRSVLHEPAPLMTMEPRSTEVREGNSNNAVVVIPRMDRKIALVHVGKTGGNTVRAAFPRLACCRERTARQMNRCYDESFRKESPISNQFDAELHMFLGNTTFLKSYTTFVWTMRNPVSRAISSYKYLHHNNTKSQASRSTHPLKQQFYKLCFPTLPDLWKTADEIFQPDTKELKPGELQTYCQQMLMTVMKGQDPNVWQINMHLRDNYKFYYSKTMEQYPGKEIMVFRTDHMWDDIKALDRATGGRGANDEDGRVSNKNIVVSNGASPSKAQFQAMCCLLWEDIVIYQELISIAVNLDFASKLEAMQDVWTTCGIDSSSLDQFKPEVGTQQAAQYSVFGFSWSSWHEQTCPPLPLKSDFKFNWTLSVENTEPTPDSKRNAPLDEALKAYPLTSKETIWDMKRKIAFANVGQAGGNDVRMAFPRMWCKRKSEDLDEIRSCVDKTYRKDSPISNAFDLELHMSLGSPNKLQSHTTFAFTMRNPIWRSIAAYQYLHHNNTSSQLAQSTHPLKETFYKQCFPTLVILLDTIDGIYKRARVGKDEEPPALEYCEELAITVFKGANIQVGSINAHLRDNYQYYYQHTAMNYPEKEIMAFRADHIWDDLENLDKATGGPGVLFEHDVATKDAKATKQPRHRSLCCVLWEELETYQTILNRATNLDGLSKAESMRDVWETCGIGGFDQFNDKVDENATRGKFDPPVLFTFSWKRWHAKSCPVVGLSADFVL